MGGGVALERADARAPQTELNPVAWLAHADLDYAEWLRQGSRLGLAGRSAAWWVGDWVRYGIALYGEKYTAAARVTGYDRQTPMNMVYVATRFDISRRRENLSWSHHAELAALDVDEQERWLERAASEHLSVRDLREELIATKGIFRRSATASRRRDSKPLPKRTVVCPHCGEEFVPRCGRSPSLDAETSALAGASDED